MTLIGYHASHEQFPPRDLLRWVQMADEAGFEGAMSSDHFHPWGQRQGHAGFAWTWLGAALETTALAQFGVVTAPGQRYHPAIIAQAAATLADMYPGRFWMAVGSGEDLNEHITGGAWPPKERRNQRLRECVEVIRALWAGETVQHDGLVRVDEARLYAYPERLPLIIGAAVSPETARWVGEWADGMVTINCPRERLQRILDAFYEGGGEDKPAFLQVHLAYGEDETALQREAVAQWGTNVFPGSITENLKMPYQFDAIARHVSIDDLSGFVRLSTDLQQHAAWIHEDIEMGFEQIYLHNVTRQQQAYIEAFGEHVLPQV